MILTAIKVLFFKEDVDIEKVLVSKGIFFLNYTTKISCEINHIDSADIRQRVMKIKKMFDAFWPWC